MAQDGPAPIDSGSTAWMIVASVLVLFMTLPGLALFYGGLVRVKNVLSVLVQCFAIAAVMSLLWVIYGYTFAAKEGTAFIGSAAALFLNGVTVDSVSGSIPESVYVMFQMTFAIITPALIVGAFAERMKFISVLLFTSLWFTLSYLPIWHMAWFVDEPTPGLFARWGVLDFAGGTVVHINAGIAGLVACILVGKRRGYRQQVLAPHNVPLTVVGAAMLWVGWFGFNAGSQLGADGVAGMAMLVTQLATAAAVVAWMIVEWLKTGKPTAVGVATGAVAGLVAITPASGTCGPMGAIAIGIAAGVGCYFGATVLKNALGYDDSLDVFGVHGIGGIIGALLTGVFASQSLGGSGADDLVIGSQVITQFKSIVVTILWSGVVSTVILLVLKVTIGLRVSEQAETEGLDSADHGESGYSLH
ncbi:MAG TPA: ammonium transporter [Verrucomicrobiales bacterium]|nr:ammonium transporter [Verrucomicrobiales bacterium]